jgi:cobalamin biosynthesis Co2+ chelatase CbiK
MFNLELTELYDFNQVRFTLHQQATGYLDDVELSIEYQKENLNHVEIWVRTCHDMVKGKIRDFAAANKNIDSEDFIQSLITQVNAMPDIGDYIDAWIWRRQKEASQND